MKNKDLRKKLMLFGVMIVLSATAVTGCSQTKTSSTASSVTTETQTQSSEDTIYIKVTSIDGDTITGTKGTLETSSDTSSDTKPSAPPSDGTSSTSSSNSSSVSSTESSSNSSDGTAPGGSAPGGSAPGGSSFVSDDTNVTFKISDSTKITVEMVQGTQDGDSSSITKNSVIAVVLDDSNTATSVIVKNLNSGSGFGGSSTVTNGTSASTINSDSSVSDQTYSSTGDDENALRVDGATVTLDGITVNKTAGSSSNTEDGDFYGQNAGLLVLNGATATIKNATVNTSVANGNGIFSYGEGTTVNVSDSTITTTGNNSGGIQTTGGGTTNATNLTVHTSGNSAAAIRSDRGGGTVNVDGGTYTTEGTGSPAIYSTANISVSNATLTANASEGVVVEGENSVTLKDTNITSSMSNATGDSTENIHGVMIYQSMSGDSEIGNAAFDMSGGSLKTTVGDLFYVTNTTCKISLSNVALTLADGNLLTVAGNSSSRGWGTEGSNGGNVTLTADNQTLTGAITVDDISTLAMTMSNGTNFTGSINSDGQKGTVSVTMDAGSTWTLSADSYVTSFSGDTSSIVSNGHHLYVNGTKVL